MTTPTPQPEKITASEIRELFANQAHYYQDLRAELEELRAILETMRGGLQQAATAPAPTGQTEAVTMTRIVRTRTNGKWYYKMQGGKYTKRGVTVWDEVLASLDLDPATIAWDTQDGHTFPHPLTVAVLLKEYTDETTGEIKTTPQKVLGTI